MYMHMHTGCPCGCTKSKSLRLKTLNGHISECQSGLLPIMAFLSQAVIPKYEEIRVEDICGAKLLLHVVGKAEEIFDSIVEAVGTMFAIDVMIVWSWRNWLVGPTGVFWQSIAAQQGAVGE